MMIPDPLAGALPTQSNTASPALSGAPPSVTGGVGTGMIPPVGGPALAPVPSPGGNAQVAGAPLSQDGANERQGGAGADLDLVKDRGTPEEFHKKNLETVGSEKATTLAFDIMKGNRTGESAGMNPEDVRREGVRMNKSLGMETEAQQDKVLNDMVFKPMLSTMRAEVETGVTDVDTAGFRGATLMANTKGVETEDDLKEIVVEVNNEITGEKIKPKDAEKLSWWGKTKKWWKKGRDDPNTKADESVETYTAPDGTQKTRPTQVTGFMGGMNRQELGMFVFQWGAMMMANSQEGLGPAMGMASGGAMAGHQKRATDATTAANEAERLELERQAQATRAGALSSKTLPTQQGILKWDPKAGEDGLGDYVPMENEEGEAYMPSALAGRPPAADWEARRWRESYPDMPEQEITSRVLAGVTPEQATLAGEKAFSQEFRAGEVFVPGKGRVRARDLKPEDKKAYIDNYVNNAKPKSSDKPALSSGGGGSGATNTGGGKLTREQFDGTQAEYDEYSTLYDKYSGS